MGRALTTTSFGGSTPRRAAHLTPQGQATRALDCRLEDGALASWREPRLIDTVTAEIKSLYRSRACCTLTSTCATSWAEGAAESVHVFATQYNDKAWPVRLVADGACAVTAYRLGLPHPTTRLALTPAATVLSKDSAPRQYVYRWRNRFCEESSASEPSQPIIVADGASVQVSGWALPPGAEEWDISEVAIYRSSSGYESPTGSEVKMDAAWMLVAVLPAASVSYVDTKRDHELYEAMDDGHVEPPPANLQGLVWLPTMNTLAGFVGAELWFSVNGRPHSWLHRIKLDDTIKGIAEAGDVIYVATDGHPYAVSAPADCDNAGCRQAVRMPQALPLVGCCSSMTAIPGGAVYPSHDGLVLMQGRAAPTLITAAHYAASDWQAMHPHTAKVVFHMGRLFVFCRKGAFALALKVGAGAAADTEHHTELSLRPDDVWATRTGQLLMRFGTEVKEWDRGVTLMPHLYESGHTLVGVPVPMGAMQVAMDPGSERLQIFVDGVQVSDDTFFQTDHAALPLWAMGQEWRWVLSGTARVKMLSIAPSTKEL